MRHQQVEKRSSGLYGVIADLTFETVVKVEKEGRLAIQEVEKTLTMDLSQVEVCSSASLALLLSWIRYAKKHHKTLTYVGLPQTLQNMIRSNELEGLIPLP